MTTDPLKILLEHHCWATRVILDLCEPLTNQQLRQEFPIGPGSLHATLSHLIGCVQNWTARAGGRPYAEPDGEKSIAQFRQQLEDSVSGIRDLIDSAAADGKLNELCSEFFRMPDGQSIEFKFTRVAAIVHCLVHGTHHRAQCLNMLRQLGVSPLPDIDPMDWHYRTETKGL